MMALQNMLIWCTVLTQLLFGHSVGVDFVHKVESDNKADGFACSLSTSNTTIVIGASYFNNGRGSVIVDEGIRINPPQGLDFGRQVDVNQHFIVVSGSEPDSVYVYESHFPHNLRASLPIDGEVEDVVISEDSTIAVSCWDNHVVSIFEYDGHGMWHMGERFCIVFFFRQVLLGTRKSFFFNSSVNNL